MKETTKKLRNENKINKKFVCDKCGFVGESNFKLQEHYNTKKHKKIEKMNEKEYFEYLDKLIKQETKKEKRKD